MPTPDFNKDVLRIWRKEIDWNPDDPTQEAIQYTHAIRDYLYQGSAEPVGEVFTWASDSRCAGVRWYKQSPPDGTKLYSRLQLPPAEHSTRGDVEMNAQQLRAILDWRMCSDPFPQGCDDAAVDAWLDQTAREFGFSNWIDAYHYA